MWITENFRFYFSDVLQFFWVMILGMQPFFFFFTSMFASHKLNKNYFIFKLVFISISFISSTQQHYIMGKKAQKNLHIFPTMLADLNETS